MKFTVGFVLLFVATLLIIPACISPILTDTGIGIEVSPLASLTRLKASEDMFNEAMDKITESVVLLSEGQVALAEELQNEAVVMQAKQAQLIADAAQQKRELEAAILAAKDESAIDWTTVILAALGVGTVGAGVPTVASRSRRGANLLTGKSRVP